MKIFEVPANATSLQQANRPGRKLVNLDGRRYRSDMESGDEKEVFHRLRNKLVPVDVATTLVLQQASSICSFRVLRADFVDES